MELFEQMIDVRQFAYAATLDDAVGGKMMRQRG